MSSPKVLILMQDPALVERMRRVMEEAGLEAVIVNPVILNTPSPTDFMKRLRGDVLTTVIGGLSRAAKPESREPITAEEAAAEGPPAGSEADAMFDGPEKPRPNPCLDPDKMLGAADQFSGHEYPGEYELDEEGPEYEGRAGDGGIDDGPTNWIRLPSNTRKRCGYTSCGRMAEWEITGVLQVCGVCKEFQHVDEKSPSPCDDCTGQDGCEVEPCPDFVKANTEESTEEASKHPNCETCRVKLLLCVAENCQCDCHRITPMPEEPDLDEASADAFDQLVADGEIETRIAVGTKEKQCATCNELAVFEVLTVVLEMGEAVERSRLACRGHLAEHVPTGTPSEIYPLEESTDTPEDIPF